MNTCTVQVHITPQCMQFDHFYHNIFIRVNVNSFVGHNLNLFIGHNTHFTYA